MRASIIRLWVVGSASGLAASIIALLVFQAAAWLGVPSAVALIRTFVELTTSPGGEASPLTRATIAGGFVAGSAFLGILFVTIVRDFPGLAATPGTLVIAGATFSSFLWWFAYSAGVVMSSAIARLSPTPQLVAALLFGGVLGALVVLAGVHETNCLDCPTVCYNRPANEPMEERKR
jgi:hypothetical protein